MHLVYAHAPASEFWAIQGQKPVGQPCKVEWRELQARAPRVELAQLMQGIDQPRKTEDFFMQGSHHLRAGRRNAVSQRLQIALQGGERRPKFMRDIGDEVSPERFDPLEA